MRVGKATIRAQRAAQGASLARRHTSPFNVRVAVLSCLLDLEPRLAQQLRYPLRCDRHFKYTDAAGCKRIRNRVEYRRWRADRAALADPLGAGDARLGQRFQMMDFDARDFDGG